MRKLYGWAAAGLVALAVIGLAGCPAPTTDTPAGYNVVDSDITSIETALNQLQTLTIAIDANGESNNTLTAVNNWTVSVIGRYDKDAAEGASNFTLRIQAEDPSRIAATFTNNALLAIKESFGWETLKITNAATAADIYPATEPVFSGENSAEIVLTYRLSSTHYIVKSLAESFTPSASSIIAPTGGAGWIVQLTDDEAYVTNTTVKIGKGVSLKINGAIVSAAHTFDIASSSELTIDSGDTIIVTKTPTTNVWGIFDPLSKGQLIVDGGTLWGSGSDTTNYYGFGPTSSNSEFIGNVTAEYVGSVLQLTPTGTITINGVGVTGAMTADFRAAVIVGTGSLTVPAGVTLNVNKPIDILTGAGTSGLIKAGATEISGTWSVTGEDGSKVTIGSDGSIVTTDASFNATANGLIKRSSGTLTLGTVDLGATGILELTGAGLTTSGQIKAARTTISGAWTTAGGTIAVGAEDANTSFISATADTSKFTAGTGGTITQADVASNILNIQSAELALGTAGTVTLKGNAATPANGGKLSFPDAAGKLTANTGGTLPSAADQFLYNMHSATGSATVTFLTSTNKLGSIASGGPGTDSWIVPAGSADLVFSSSNTTIGLRNE